jgi:phosphoinositide-3-kinase regulatory subunit 4
MGNASSIDSIGSSGQDAASTTPDAANQPPSPSSSSNPRAIRRGNFNPHVTIQTLGSASTALDDNTSGYTYYGVGYATNENNSPGTAGDALATSITKDLNPSTIGGQIVGIHRLWPGSGRMMRSYRLRIRVPRMNSNTGSIDSNSPAAAAESLPFTVELACKSFIVRSDRGQNPLKQTLTEGDAELKRLRTILSDPAKHPHILSYARWIVGPMSTQANAPASPANNIVSRPIHLLRQHAHASLSDRLVSRPFLTLIEKNWITFQLLNAIQSLHDAGVCHGHITTENVLLTSWNWVLISDVGCQHYKPVALPDDDPGLWIHWFEGRGGEERKEEHHSSGNGEKKCCLAPERFYTPGKNVDVPTKLTPAMDTFSLGCVLIELFLNGERALDLGDLMEYRRQGDKEASSLPQSLKQKLDKIESSKIRAACRHMLSMDPSSRLSPTEYLERLSSNKTKKTTETAESSTYAPIPPCFKATLLPFVLRLRTEIQSPDVRIALVACSYSDIVKATIGLDDEWGAAYFSRILGPTIQRFEGSPASSSKSDQNENKSKASNNHFGGLCNLTLDELLSETESLMKQLDSGMFDPKNLNALPQHDNLSPILSSKPTCLLDNTSKFADESLQSTPSQASIIVILQVILSSVRHVRRTSSKFVALKLMHRIALFSSDEIRLQRIVPIVTSLLQDSEPIVRALGISVLTSVLSIVTTFPPSDAQLFPCYVFKKVAHLITDPSLIVRVAFARNIATLLETSLRFLEIGHSVALYDAVCGTATRDVNAGENEKAPLFSEEAANLLGGGSPDKKTQISSNTNPEDSSTVLIRNTYDADLAVLHEVVLRWVVHITTDTSDHSSQSKQALLSDLPRLCSFFGAEHSFQILPQILAFFNDRRDWQLRASVLRHLPSVCVAVGRAATEQFVVPCIESALNDDEEQVVNEALACMSTLISTSLLSRTTLLGTEATQSSHRDGRPRREKEGVIKKTATLLFHPLDAVRKNAASFIYMCWKDLGETDVHGLASQMLQPYLRYSPSLESLHQFLACLKISDTTLGHKSSPIKHHLRTSNINTEIEFSVKLARILSVPSQWFKDAFIPPWYESLNAAASANSTLSDPSISLGIRALEQGKSTSYQCHNCQSAL